MPTFNPAHKTELDALLLRVPHVRAGKMFGYPACYADRKLCICLYEQSVAVKLPKASADKLLNTDRNAVPFQPMGRTKMREWVQLNVSPPEDYRGYQRVFEESIRYVLAQQGDAAS